MAVIERKAKDSTSSDEYVADDGAGLQSNTVPMIVQSLPDEDRLLWVRAFEEALTRGAGRDVAKFFANHTLLVVRERRDGAVAPGAGDYSAYR